MSYGVEISGFQYYSVENMCICRGGIDSPPYGVDYIYAVDTMMWTTCVYTVGNMGYAVGICRGVHLLVIYAVGNHMVWTTVVHTIYGLLSTVYIWCGSMVWVTLSYADATPYVAWDWDCLSVCLTD